MTAGMLIGAYWFVIGEPGIREDAEEVTPEPFTEGFNLTAKGTVSFQPFILAES